VTGWLTAFLTAFILIVPVELPDKTFVATLVLSTRFKPLPTWADKNAAMAAHIPLPAATSSIQPPVRQI